MVKWRIIHKSVRVQLVALRQNETKPGHRVALDKPRAFLDRVTREPAAGLGVSYDHNCGGNGENELSNHIHGCPLPFAVGFQAGRPGQAQSALY